MDNKRINSPAADNSSTGSNERQLGWQVTPIDVCQSVEQHLHYWGQWITLGTWASALSINSCWLKEWLSLAMQWTTCYCHLPCFLYSSSHCKMACTDLIVLKRSCLYKAAPRTLMNHCLCLEAVPLFQWLCPTPKSLCGIDCLQSQRVIHV